MIIVNKEKKRLILNGIKGSHNFDTYPVLIKDFEKEEKGVTKKKKKSSLHNFSSDDFDQSLQLKLFLVLNKEKILNGEVGKVEVLLERSQQQSSTSRSSKTKGSAKSQKKSSQSFSYSREKLFDNRSNTISDVSAKKKSSKNSGNFISKKIRSYESRSRKNIAEKMKDENFRRIGFFSFDDVINSATVSKTNSPNFSKEDTLGVRKKYVLEDKPPENITKFKKASGQNRKINPDLNRSRFAGVDQNNIDLDISKSKDMRNMFSSGDVLESSLRSKLAFRLQTNFTSNDEAFKSLQSNSSVTDLNLNSSRFSSKDSRFSNPSSDFSQPSSIVKNQYNSAIQKALSSADEVREYVISEYKQIKQIDLFSQVFVINKTKINELTNGNNLSFLIRVRNAKGRIVDSFSQQVNLKELRYLRDFPEFDYDVSVVRRGSKNILKVKNNDDALLDFNIYRKTFKNARDRSFRAYSRVKTLSIAPGQTSIFKDEVTFGTSNYRVTITHDGSEFNNFKSAEAKDLKTSSRVQLDDSVNIIARNSSEGGHDAIKIELSSIPNNIKKITVVKRNLSKRQRTFSQVLSFSSRSQAEEGDQGNNSPLLVSAGNVFVGRDSSNLSFSFFDDDVEDQEVYEYKAKICFSNGETKLSSTSAMEMFEKRLGLVSLDSLRISTTGDLGANIPGSTTRNFTLSGVVSNRSNEITRVFEDLGRNNFELFKDDLSQIRESISKNLTLKVELVSRHDSEIIDLGEVQAKDAGGNSSSSSQKRIDFNFTVPSSTDFSNTGMMLKVTPLTALNSDMISQVNEKIDRLVRDAVVSNDQTYNLLGAKKKLDRINNKTKSTVSRKFSSRDYSKKGRIVSPEAKSVFSRTSSVIEKESTGDIRYISISGESNVSDSTLSVSFENMNLLKSDESIVKRTREDLSLSGIMNLNLSTAGRNIDFIVLHSISRNGHINNHGMLFNSFDTNPGFEIEERDIVPLRCYFELNNPVGIYKFFAIVVYPNGEFSNPIHIKNLKIDSRSVEVF